MYSLYRKYKDREFIYIIPLLLLSLAVRIRYYLKIKFSEQGFPTSDDSDWYLEYARGLLADFQIGLHLNDLLYMGYNFLLAFMLAIFEEQNTILLFQAIVAAVSVIFVYQIAIMLFNRRTAIIASLIYTISWDITLWTTYILTDSFFISLLLVNVFLLLKYMQERKRIYQILFILTSLYMIVFRPTGIVSLLFILIYIVIHIPKAWFIDVIQKYKLIIAGFMLVGIGALLYVSFSNILDPFVESIQYNAKLVLYNVYGNGWIYDIPSPHDVVYKPDYTINIGGSLILSFLINNWDHISIVYMKRAVAFLGRWVWSTDFSSVGSIFKFLVHLSIAILYVIGTVAALINKTFRKASILWLVTLAVFIFCIVLFIDGMYRYRAPGIPFIAIVVAYGADRVISGCIRIAKNYTGKKLPWHKGEF